MIYFEGSAVFGGETVHIQATSDDDVRTIAHKALQLEFGDEIAVYEQYMVTQSAEIPEKYISFSIDYGINIVHGDNAPLIDRHEIAIFFVTKDLEDLKIIPKRIEKSMFRKGFKISEKAADLSREQDTEYFASMIKVSWTNGVRYES